MYTYESAYGWEIAAFTRSSREITRAAWSAPTFDTKADAQDWILEVGK